MDARNAFQLGDMEYQEWLQGLSGAERKYAPDDLFCAGDAGLYAELVANHLVVSQFPEGSGVNKGNFVRRNRTMALLSDATVVVEASNTSGTRFQALEALRLGAEVLTRENAGELLGAITPTFRGTIG